MDLKGTNKTSYMQMAWCTYLENLKEYYRTLKTNKWVQQGDSVADKQKIQSHFWILEMSM